MAEMRLVIAGAAGRMGRTLIKAAAEMAGVTVCGALEHAGSPLIGQDAGVLSGLPENGIKLTSDPAAALRDADGVIDFTIPQATVELAARAAEAGCAHIIGTTGLSGAQEAQIEEAASRIAIVKSGNMSLGVNLLQALVKRVAATLDEDFDIEIVEMHHNKTGTGLVVCAVCGPPVAGSRISLAIAVVGGDQQRAAGGAIARPAMRPSPASTASTALIAAGRLPVWPTMSGLAKLSTIRSYLPEAIASDRRSVSSGADISGCRS
jgi:hypothetical protein